MCRVAAGVPAAQLCLECAKLMAASLRIAQQLRERVTKGDHLMILDGHPSVREQLIEPFLVPDEEVELTVQIWHSSMILLQRYDFPLRYPRKWA